MDGKMRPVKISINSHLANIANEIPGVWPDIENVIQLGKSGVIVDFSFCGIGFSIKEETYSFESSKKIAHKAYILACSIASYFSKSVFDMGLTGDIEFQNKIIREQKAFNGVKGFAFGRCRRRLKECLEFSRCLPEITD